MEPANSPDMCPYSSSTTTTSRQTNTRDQHLPAATLPGRISKHTEMLAIFLEAKREDQGSDGSDCFPGSLQDSSARDCYFRSRCIFPGLSDHVDLHVSPPDLHISTSATMFRALAADGVWYVRGETTTWRLKNISENTSLVGGGQVVTKSALWNFDALRHAGCGEGRHLISSPVARASSHALCT